MVKLLKCINKLIDQLKNTFFSRNFFHKNIYKGTPQIILNFEY